MTQTVLLGDILYPVSETMKFTDEKVIFLNTSDIEAGKFLHKNLSDPKTLPGQAKKKIQKDDILFSEIRPANKRFAYVDFSDTELHVISTKLMVLRSNEIVYPKYAYHWLTAPQQLEQLQTIAESRSGTFPQITFDTIKTLKVKLPDYPEQVKIAEFIDSIDEKNELNRQMNETLEQMGQALFRHYFIDNPEADEWEDGKLSDIADVLTGKGSVKSQMSENGEVPLYGANGVMGTSEDYLYDEPLIITGRVGTLGKVRAITGQAWFSDNVLIMKPRPGYFGYVLRVAKAFDYISMNRGSSQPLITQTDLRNRQIKLPDNRTLLLFENQHNDIFDMQQKNAEQIQTLTTLRDTLLPRLISGKVKV